MRRNSQKASGSFGTQARLLLAEAGKKRIRMIDSPRSAEWLPRTGDAAERIRSCDWSNSPLGPISEWPQSLRASLSICLDSRFPIVIYWGPDLVMLYNDAYAPITGDKHPQALGASGREVWAEIWPVIGPMLEQVMAGAATWSDDQLLQVDRFGFTEEAYFSFSFSPIRGSGGEVEGIFTAVTETTERVIEKRRLRTLRDLSARSLEQAKSAEEACRVTATTLTENGADAPFALIYLVDGEVARLASASGVDAGSRYAPSEVRLDEDAGSVWPLASIVADAAKRQIDVHDWQGLPTGHWDQPPRSVLVLPITTPGQTRPGAVLVAGVSPRRPLDEAYETFFATVASHVSTALANARAYEEERRRAEALAAVDRAKTLFFTNISHEFRTPLTLMLGPVDDLLDGAGGQIPPGSREQLEVVQRQGKRLLKLVNALLDFSRLEAGRMQAVYEWTDICAYTADLASTFRSAIEKAGLRFVVDCPPLTADVCIDRDMWEKIVFNLLSNAFKFTLQGEIELRLREVGASIELTVLDTGSGIPADQLPHVFERFHRVEGTRGRTHEGTGIGLALVDELVRLHGGTIRAESRIGHGSTFTVTIPTGSAHLPADRIGAARGQTSTAARPEVYLAETAQWVTEDAKPAVASTGERRRILLVDDNADMRDYVRRILAEWYDVDGVANGRRALESIAQVRPDLVLTDVMMPEMDGFELLAAIRHDPELQQLPVIMLSARAGEEARIDGVQAGADDYIIKPFSARELLARVAAQLDMAHIRREAREQVARSEASLRAIVTQTTAGIAQTDLSGRFVFANDRYCEMVGRSSDELLGLHMQNITHPDDRQRNRSSFEDAAFTGAPFVIEQRYIRGDGSEVWVSDSVSRVVDGGVEPKGILAVSIDITDRKRAEQAIEASAQALREADRMKNEFLATLSHELRTPLTSIVGWTQLLLSGNLDKDDQAVALEAIRRAAQAQAQLVDDVLDVSRITTGKMRLDRVASDLHAIVEDAVAAVRPAAEAKQIPIELRLDRTLPRHFVDRARLQQVVWNLLTNAIKFSPAQASIEVILRRDESFAVIEVADHGRGIRPDFLPHIFERFRQADSSTSRSHTGLGLGLALVKELIELHGGTVSAESEEGRGSRFRVRLPMPVVEPMGVEEAPAASVPQRDHPLRGLRVLYVDDREDARLLIATMLRQYGAEVVNAGSVDHALVTLKETRPHVVLTDIALPDRDGYDLLESIRSDTEHSTLPVLALTAQGRLDDERRATVAGFHSYLRKPIEPDDLAAAISRAVVKAGD